MLNKLSTLIKNHQGTFYLLFIFCALVAGVVISKNDTVAGIIIGYLATIILAVIVTRNWRKIRMFLILLIVSAVGFVLLSFLHELIYDFGVITSDTVAWQRYILWYFHMSISIIVGIVCPVGFFIGVAGCVTLWIGRRRKKIFDRT